MLVQQLYQTIIALEKRLQTVEMRLTQVEQQTVPILNTPMSYAECTFYAHNPNSPIFLHQMLARTFLCVLLDDATGLVIPTGVATVDTHPQAIKIETGNWTGRGTLIEIGLSY